MKSQKSITIVVAILIIATTILLDACTKDYLVPQPPPYKKVSKETANLEASYVSNPPNTVNSSYWRTADYLKIEMTELNKQKLYGLDGVLNATGTYKGIPDFNGGDPADLTLKAAYNDEKIFILAEWTDSDVDASRFNFVFNGQEDPLQASMSADLWTSQRNDDQISFAFDLLNSSSSAGTFSNVGCAATCHAGKMQPENGSVDIWNWSLALSEPLGYALDMVSDASNGLQFDQGQNMFERNALGDYRSGPMYEWDGTSQTITKPDGSIAILDPGFYLYNKMAFVGSPSQGKGVYETACGETCHGVKGEGNGPDLDGPPFNVPGLMNRFSFEAFKEYGNSVDHSGFSKFKTLSDAQLEDVLALIRGFTGVPGYYLQDPNGSASDLHTNTNILVAKVSPLGTQYKVLIIRDLNTGNGDDVQFDPATVTDYIFGIALMDSDGINHIGSLKETLTFVKP